MNGKPGSNFQPERGIRQDAHISPYMFIIFVKYLGRYTNFMPTQGRSDIGIKVAKYCPKNPYLMLADDCLIFCGASKEGCKESVM